MILTCFKTNASLPDRLVRSFKQCQVVAVGRWAPVLQQQAWAPTPCSSPQPAQQAANMVASAVRISQDSATITRTNSALLTTPILKANRLPLRRHSRLPTSRRLRLELLHLRNLRKRNPRSPRRRMIHTIQNRTTMTMMTTTRATRASLKTQRKSVRRQSVRSAELSKD